MASPSFHEAGEKFLQWFKSLPGATFSDAIEIVDLRDRNAGRGIIATQNIEAETTLFTTPRKSIINVETSDLSKKLPDVFDLDKVTDEEDDANPQMDSWSSLILVMIYEYFKGDTSAWKPYFDVLPAAFETPMFWQEDELEELQASHMRGRIGKANAEDMFRKTLLPIIRQNSELFVTSGDQSDDDVVNLAHRMGSTIMSYAFDLEGDEEEENEEEEWVEDREGKSMMGMVPMADILNADAEFNAHVNHEEDVLTVTSLRPIMAGQEVLNYYGPHPNSELLRRYGYVSDKHSRYDIVELPWKLIESAMAAQMGIDELTIRKACDEFEEDELEDTFIVEREISELNPDGTFSGPAKFSGISEDLHEQLKAVIKATKNIQPDALPDKRKRDEVFVAIFVKALERLASQYPTTVAEDELLLKNNNLGMRTRMAIMVRIGEKKLLQEAMEAMQTDTDVEMAEADDLVPQKRVKR